MAGTELDELKRRIQAARDFAQKEERELLAEAEQSDDVAVKLGRTQEATNYTALRRVLNVALGEDPSTGSPTA